MAAGKGVLILDNIEQARAELEAMLLHSKFGKASASVVIEEFLSGIELSCFVLTDGKSYKILPNAKDYKRIGENDTGLNTGGMGAVSPVPFADEVFLQKVDDQIIKPTIQGIASDRLNYKGFIFIGLINVNGQPKVIEYNVRMGDPETEVVLPRIENDLLEMLDATAENRLEDVEIKVDSRACTTVMLVSGGYPEAYEKGKVIRGLDKVDNAIVFHAGAQQEAEKIVTSGGRVLAITAYGDDFRSALDTSYKNITRIAFDGMYYRKDIGFDL